MPYGPMCRVWTQVPLLGGGSPRFVRVRQPYLLRVERADQPLAVGTGVVEFAEPHSRVASDHNRTLSGVPPQWRVEAMEAVFDVLEPPDPDQD